MIAWAFETFVASTLLMLLVLSLRGPVRRAFGPGMAYALWLLPVLRMALPPLPGQWQLTQLLAPVARQAEAAPGIAVGVFDPASVPAQVAPLATEVTVELGGTAAHAAVVAPVATVDGPSLVAIVLALWAAGALSFLLYHLVAHSLFCRRLLRAARIDRTVAQGRVRVIETGAAHGPLAFGIWRKYVAFPRDFAERYDAQERDLALAHELGHHVRGDLVANWVALVVLALHWFNPVAWRAFRAFRADQEMACDALVLAGRAQALRHAYGRAIVKSAHGGAVSAACHLHTINEVKGRLKMLSKTRTHSPTRILAGMVGVGALTLAGLGLTASGTQAATHFAAEVGTAIGLADQPRPPVPAAPAAPAAPVAAQAPEAPQAPDAPLPPEAPAAPDADGVYRWTEKGADGKVHQKIVMVNAKHLDGKVPDLAEIEKSIPEIKEGKCGTSGGEAKHFVLKSSGEGGKVRMVICADRIDAFASDMAKVGEAQAAAGREHAKIGIAYARIGLQSARAAIASNGGMTAEQRAEALKGIDEAIAQLEREHIDD